MLRATWEISDSQIFAYRAFPTRYRQAATPALCKTDYWLLLSSECTPVLSKTSPILALPGLMTEPMLQLA